MILYEKAYYGYNIHEKNRENNAYDIVLEYHRGSKLYMILE